jgi:hypothetical protein
VICSALLLQPCPSCKPSVKRHRKLHFADTSASGIPKLYHFERRHGKYRRNTKTDKGYR